MDRYKPQHENARLLTEIDTVRSEIKDVYFNILKVIKGKDEVVKKLLIGIITNGHILLYDVPGVGKTVLAKTLAKSISANFKRIQFTPDLLPSDVTGVNIYDPNTKKFEFQTGPVFTNILLADEINRTSPKTQSSLLEAMEERQVSIDNTTYKLPGFFFVIATQNPIEHDGTYPLPAAQLDRFLFRLELGYPSRETEIDLINTFSATQPLETLGSVVNADQILNWQIVANKIYLGEAIVKYCVDLARATRELAGNNIGVSPRGAILLAKAAKSTALLNGRDYVLPDDVLYIIANVFSHRLAEAGKTGESLVREIIQKVVIV